MSGTNPDCQAVTLETIDVNNNIGKETKYVTTSDLKGLSPCWFPDNKNPINNSVCPGKNEGFENLINDDFFYQSSIFNSSDLIAYIYFLSLIFLIACLIDKKQTK